MERTVRTLSVTSSSVKVQVCPAAQLGPPLTARLPPLPMSNATPSRNSSSTRCGAGSGSVFPKGEVPNRI